MKRISTSLKCLAVAAATLCTASPAAAADGAVTVGPKNLVGDGVELWLANGSAGGPLLHGRVLLHLRGLDEPKSVTCRFLRRGQVKVFEYFAPDGELFATGLKFTFDLPSSRSLSFVARPDAEGDYLYSMHVPGLRHCTVRPL